MSVTTKIGTITVTSYSDFAVVKATCEDCPLSLVVLNEPQTAWGDAENWATRRICSSIRFAKD